MSPVLFSVFRLLGARRLAAGQSWRREYWLVALALPAFLYSLDALRIWSFSATRAPNVGLTAQLALLLAFYGAWVSVPRMAWAVASRTMRSPEWRWRSLSSRLALLGVALSCLHLMMLAFVLRVMHAPPNWGWRQLLQSFAEVWLGQAGLWLFIYFAVSALVVYRLTERTSPERLTRYEARQNGKTLSIRISDIYWVGAAGNYSELFTANGVVTVRKTLSQIGHELAGAGVFLRSHRSALVNGSHVLAIRPLDHGGGYRVQLTEDQEAPLSRRELTRFRLLLRTAGS